jgi:hypothetical protein
LKILEEEEEQNNPMYYNPNKEEKSITKHFL